MATKKRKRNARSRSDAASIIGTHEVAIANARAERQHVSARDGIEAYLRGYRDAITNLTRRALADVAPNLEDEYTQLTEDSKFTWSVWSARYTRDAVRAAALVSPCYIEIEDTADLRPPDAEIQ